MLSYYISYFIIPNPCEPWTPGGEGLTPWKLRRLKHLDHSRYLLHLGHSEHLQHLKFLWDLEHLEDLKLSKHREHVGRAVEDVRWWTRAIRATGDPKTGSIHAPQGFLVSIAMSPTIDGLLSSPIYSRQRLPTKNDSRALIVEKQVARCISPDRKSQCCTRTHRRRWTN